VRSECPLCASSDVLTRPFPRWRTQTAAFPLDRLVPARDTRVKATLWGALMKIITAFAVGLALVGALPAAPAQAGAARTFVSPTGNDSNLCTLVAPCRFLQAALAQTNPGGEIAVLGTAGYNNGLTVTITQAVSIVNPGGFEAGIIVLSGGTGIVIAAGTSDAVSLRGLTIEGGGVGNAGIQFNTGKSLTVENCVIRHVTGDGINFFPNARSSLSVTNTVSSDNGGDGIVVLPSGSGTVSAVFNRVETNNNGNNGILVEGDSSTGTVKATVSDSVAARNAEGFYALSSPGHALTTLSLFHSVAANNGVGIVANGTGATLRAAQSMVTGNATAGWFIASSGVVASYGDNYIDGNGPNSGSLTSIARQ
jgi:hypothetical protein